MSCDDCQRERTATLLVSGDQVCTSCPRWRFECEVRWLLRRPTAGQRKTYLWGDPTDTRRGGVVARRGKAAAQELESAMWDMYEKVKNDAKKNAG